MLTTAEAREIARKILYLGYLVMAPQLSGEKNIYHESKIPPYGRFDVNVLGLAIQRNTPEVQELLKILTDLPPTENKELAELQFKINRIKDILKDG